MAFYSVVLHDTRDDTIHIYKASDPTGTWTSQVTYVLDGAIKTLWTVVHSDSKIYITLVALRKVNQDSYVSRKFLRYDTATDTIDIDEEEINDNVAAMGEPPDAPSIRRLNITHTVRSDADVVCVYSTGESNVRSAIRTTSFAASVSFDIEGAQGIVSVLGASDMSHFFWHNTSGDVEHRSINSSDTLGTASDVDTSTGVSDNGLAGAITFNDGTARVRVAYLDANDTISSAYGNDVQNPTWTIETSASDSAVYDPSSTGIIACLALDGQVSHLMYVREVDQDVHRSENDGIGGWGSDTEEQDAVTANAISCSVYDRSGQKLAYIWDSAGTTTYDEVDIGVAVILPQEAHLILQAVHRASSW